MYPQLFSLSPCAGWNPGMLGLDGAVIFNIRRRMCNKDVRATRFKEPGSLMIVHSHTSPGPFIVLLYEREINFYLIYAPLF